MDTIKNKPQDSFSLSGSAKTESTKKLRASAEQLSHADPALQINAIESLSPAEINNLIHELQIHQIELQLQNDELQQTHLQLETAREKYFELYDTAPVGYLTFNDKGIITELNLTFSSLIDYPRQYSRRKPLSQFILAADQDIFYKHKLLLQSTGSNHVCELRMVTQDGVEFWARLESSLVVSRIASEEGRLYRCIISDISGEKSREQLLAEQFRLLQALINSCENVVAFSLDRSYRYTAYNKPHCAEMQKVWRANIKIGDKILDYMTDPGMAFLAKHSMDRALRGERFVEEVQQTERNSIFEMEWNPIYDEQSQVVGLTAFGRDITDRKKAEAIIRDNNVFLEQKVQARTLELELSKTELEAFSSSVAHDLGGSLITIDGFSQILEEDYAHVLDAEAMSHLQLIRKNTAAMSVFIQELQHLARISQGDISFYEVNMHKIIANIWAEVDAETQANFQIHYADLPEALSDFSLANVIWTNLISNAVKFTRDQPERVITITGSKKAHHVEYCISDTGVGFDMSKYPKLFAVFHKLHSDSLYEGNGVGLAIVKRIVTKHWGKVWAESEVGKGARFYFTLPLVE